MIKQTLKNILPDQIKQKIIYILGNYMDRYSLKSYSQEGEDMILKRIFETKKVGFYIDVGAHHPKRFSNTYFFYKKGWKGINIDAMPGSMKLFDRFRPRDTNIEKAISDKKEILTYYVFNEPALNTFSQEKAKKCLQNNYKQLYEKKLETTTLEEILDASLPKNKQIDFLSIDVEGLDVVVLKSNDFTKYRPKVILIEILDIDINDIYNNDIAIYLKNIEYAFFAKTVNTCIFIDKYTLDK